MNDPTTEPNASQRVARTAGQATIGAIVAGVLVAFGVVTGDQGTALAPAITILAAWVQNRAEARR